MANRPPAALVTSASVRVLTRLFQIAERECKASGLSLPQYRALLAVSAGSRRASELADSAVVSRPAVSVLLGALEEQGLLRREPMLTGDRRGVHVAIMDSGRESVARAEQRMSGALDELLADSDSVPAVVDELRKLQNALDADVEHDLRSRAEINEHANPAAGSNSAR